MPQAPNRLLAHAMLDVLLNKLEGVSTNRGLQDQGNCINAVMEAAKFVSEMLGDEVLRTACGAPPSTDDRVDVLRAMFRQIAMANRIFEGMTGPDRNLLGHVGSEIAYLLSGDKPRLFAKLPGKTKPARVAGEKFNALLWEAYLIGLGISELTARNAISEAYLHPWDTIARWRGDELVVLGGSDDSFVSARQHGELARSLAIDIERTDLPLPLQPTPGSGWRDGVAKAGKAYRLALELKIAGE